MMKRIDDMDRWTEGYRAGWDAAVDASTHKAMLLQDGFRKLLKESRVDLEALIARKEGPGEIAQAFAEVSSGEALVGVLGDVVRNIAALKGQYPR